MLKHNSKGLTGKILMFCMLGLALSAMPSWALTQPALEISDGTKSVTVDSTGATTYGGGCSAVACPTTVVSASATSISWSGTIGTFTVTNAQGQVLGTPNIDLGLTSASTTASGTLYIWFTSQFTSGTGPFTISAA